LLPAGPGAVIAHGAGKHTTPSLKSFEGLVTRVSLPCASLSSTPKGRKSPDRQPLLVACWKSVADWVKRELAPSRLFLGGRSMGGRMASHLVADGYPCDGIFFLAYPLHPPGKRDQQRKDHLPKIRVPMLFISGTADAFAELDLLEPVVRDIGASLHLLEKADHGFRVPKSSG
jgi:predicted alpha/beta-hydrolase family hydrolase